MPFFQGAINTDASNGVFNDVRGDQYNVVRHEDTSNEDSNNTITIANANSNNELSANWRIGAFFQSVKIRSTNAAVGFRGLESGCNDT